MPSRGRQILAALALLAASPSLAAGALKCEITKKFQCGFDGGCLPLSPKVWNIVDKDRGTFARCDSSGCDTYQARFFQSGNFLLIEVTGRGLFAKISESMGFLESASLGLGVLVSHGQCRGM